MRARSATVSLFSLLCSLAVSVAADPDPGSVYTCLFDRPQADAMGTKVHWLDPPVWTQTHHLLRGDSHRRALACLDELWKTAPQEPLKRVVLQHDLWAVFDWAAASGEEPEQSRELEVRL